MSWREVLCHAKVSVRIFLKVVRSFLYFRTNFYIVVVMTTAHQVFPAPFLLVSQCYYTFSKLLLWNLGLSVSCLLIRVSNELNKEVMDIISSKGFKTTALFNMSFSFTWPLLKHILRWRVYLSHSLSRTTTPYTHCMCYTHKTVLSIWYDWEINYCCIKLLKIGGCFLQKHNLTFLG